MEKEMGMRNLKQKEKSQGNAKEDQRKYSCCRGHPFDLRKLSPRKRKR